MRRWAVTLLCLLTLVLPCASRAEGNPARHLVTSAQRQTLATLQNIDEGRLYVMDYTADYKLDEALACGAYTPETLFAFAQGMLLSGDAAAARVNGYGCSSFAAHTADGVRMVGRNYDYRMDTTALLVRLAPKDGYRSLNMTSVGWIGYGIGMLDDGRTDLSALMLAPYLTMDGVNEKGLSVSTLAVGSKPTRQDTGKPKVSTTVVTRLLLDRAADVNEALALLRQIDYQSIVATNDDHFFLADAVGRAVVVEYCDNQMEVLGKNHVTNHYLSPKVKDSPRSGDDRYDILNTVLGYQRNRLSREQTMSLLSFVSQDPEIGRGETQWSVVYNLTRPGITVAIRRNYGALFTFTMDDLSGR